MGNANNVNAFTNAIAGGIRVAPAGTAVPTDATTELSAEFRDLGYVTEDGMSRSFNTEREPVKQWNGGTVKFLMGETEATFSFSLMETSNLDTLRFVYGADSVVESATAGYTVIAGADEAPEVVLVFDMYSKNPDNRLRIVVERAQITELGEVSYTHGEITALEVTVSAMESADGSYFKEYHVPSSTTGTTPEEIPAG